MAKAITPANYAGLRLSAFRAFIMSISSLPTKLNSIVKNVMNEFFTIIAGSFFHNTAELITLPGSIR
jgi:hypothetical protein